MADDWTRQAKEVAEKMAQEARSNPGTPGVPELLADGGPGDADAMATFIASLCYAAGVRCRFVFVRSPDDHGAVFVEAFNSSMHTPGSLAKFPPEARGGFHAELPTYQWVPLLAHHGWVQESVEILTWKRYLEVEL